MANTPHRYIGIPSSLFYSRLNRRAITETNHLQIPPFCPRCIITTLLCYLIVPYLNITLQSIIYLRFLHSALHPACCCLLLNQRTSVDVLEVFHAVLIKVAAASLPNIVVHCFIKYFVTCCSRSLRSACHQFCSNLNLA